MINQLGGKGLETMNKTKLCRRLNSMLTSRFKQEDDILQLPCEKATVPGGVAGGDPDSSSISEYLHGLNYC